MPSFIFHRRPAGEECATYVDAANLRRNFARAGDRLHLLAFRDVTPATGISSLGRRACLCVVQ